MLLLSAALGTATLWAAALGVVPLLLVAAALMLVAAVVLLLVAILPAPQHLHIVTHDLGDVALYAILIVVIPGADPAFDVQLRTLFHVLFGHLCQSAPKHDIVPLGLFDPLTVPVFIDLACCKRELANGRIFIQVPCFGVFPDISNKDHFIYCHIAFSFEVQRYKFVRT